MGLMEPDSDDARAGSNPVELEISNHDGHNSKDDVLPGKTEEESEHDKPNDFERFAKRSIAALKGMEV